MNLLSTLMLCLSANIDTLTVGISFGLNKIRISIIDTMIIAFISTFGTFISMIFGQLINDFISIDLANIIGGVIIIIMGAWIILDCIFKKRKKNSNNQCHYQEIINEPSKVDTDMSGDISIKESLVLSLALTINNIAIGIAASMTGVSILLTCIFTFILTLLTLYIGNKLGGCCLSKFLGNYTSLLAGLLMIVLGLYETFF